MSSNRNQKKSERNCSPTIMNNTRLYLSMIILKQPKKRKSREDLEEQGLNLKPWIPHGVENSMQKTVHRRKLCSFTKNKERPKKDICHNIMAQPIIQDDIIEYKKETAEVAAIIIGEIKYGIKEKGASYAQQFSF